jgi:hypothetical protein
MKGGDAIEFDYVLRDLPLEHHQRLRPELERIARTPTQEEIVEGTRDAAQEGLHSIQTDVDTPES